MKLIYVELIYLELIYSYQFDGPVKRNIKIATVKLEKGVWSIIHDLTPTSSEGTSKELYGLKSNEFHKVNLICLSPNHWGDTPVGNKHYMFLLNKCKNLNDLRTFHQLIQYIILQLTHF